MRDHEDRAGRVSHGAIHLSRFVLEDPVGRHALGKTVGRAPLVSGGHAEEHQEPRADRSDFSAVHAHGGTAHAL